MHLIIYFLTLVNLQAEWTQQLSELCTPLVSNPQARMLVEEVINFAYILYIKISSDCAQWLRTSYTVVILNPGFVRQVLALWNDNIYNSINNNDKQANTRFFSHRLLRRLCILSPLERQQLLIQVTDQIMIGESGAQNRTFIFPSRKHIVDNTLMKSPLFFCLQEGAIKSNDDDDDSMDDGNSDAASLIRKAILEDIAGMAEEINDWRFMAVCSMLVGWILVQGKQRQHYFKKVQPHMIIKKFNHELGKGVTACPLQTMLSCVYGILDSKDTQTLEDHHSDMMALFLTAQHQYIFCGGGPSRLFLRRRLALLVGSVLAQRDGYLVHQIQQYLKDSISSRGKEESALEERNVASPTKAAVRAVAAVALKGEGEGREEKKEKALASFIAATLVMIYGPGQAYADMILEQTVLLLQELKRMFLSPLSKTTAVKSIERIFLNYQPIFRTYAPFVVYLVCAVGIMLESRKTECWQFMIQMAISVMCESKPDNVILTKFFLALFRDLSGDLNSYTLEQALDNLAAVETEKNE
ncbi:hypothetical protein BCR41DRAFT_182296 [Lobosporangium transversale]|uniref:Uncharacterized protein n=1 Tax=Lobosporangium transversale TaxID=64571 RepID=A0A1Y2GZ88_9FUNG|nr:hypothetical protein BCR41DRAFT_182296 [Lobosporangium transversale]ORZ27071.1 hypothetical protein BCR41DRAFT_182296 [Lobosporangium transversale]|eukprot:XP_021884818.1 hypothetical protein BCR41DRAFT_182296 [Lobosporangium transversale]